MRRHKIVTIFHKGVVVRLKVQAISAAGAWRAAKTGRPGSVVMVWEDLRDV